MRRKFLRAFKRHEIYVISAVIGLVFVAAMFIVAWLLRSSAVAPPYEALAQADLKRVFATGYLRHREDDGTPYLKVEVHNGTLWWIKRMDIEFEGTLYTLRDSEAFRPLHFGAIRLNLNRIPLNSERIEYDLNITRAAGYPPARITSESGPHRMAVGADRPKSAY